MRENHECAQINRAYGFYDECKRRYNVKLWKLFVDLFNILPIGACIDDKILLVHGGISPELTSVGQFKEIKRPTDVPETRVFFDVLWSDPCSTTKEFDENERWVGYTFKGNTHDKFLNKNNLDLLFTAHQVLEEVYKFFGDRELVTVFSVPNYIGEFDNSDSIMMVDHNLMYSFRIFKDGE